MSAHGGYCGPAVKPIALHLVQQITSDPEVNLPVSGIGGIQTWRDAAEFILLGCGTVQVCTAVMHYGYRIVEDMIDGLSNWMDEKGYATLEDFRGLSIPRMTEWKHLDLNFKIVARIDPSKCIGCDLCYVACWDGAHQCIHHEGSREAPAVLQARSRAGIAVTPNREAGFRARQREERAQPPRSRGGRGGVRGLQPVLAGLPRGELHHHGAGGNGQAEGELAAEDGRAGVRAPGTGVSSEWERP